MKRIVTFLTAFAALHFAPPAAANFLTELSFEQKFEQSDLVVIGTATVVDRGGQHRVGSTVTLSVWRTLKGEHHDTIVVSTYSRIAEADPRCCEAGATYMMFLRRAPRDGELYSVNGPYGMVRIAGPRREVRTFPSDEVEGETVDLDADSISRSRQTRNAVFVEPSALVGRQVELCGFVDGPNILESADRRQWARTGGISIVDRGPLHPRFRGRACVAGLLEYFGCAADACNDAAFDYGIRIGRVISQDRRE